MPDVVELPVEGAEGALGERGAEAVESYLGGVVGGLEDLGGVASRWRESVGVQY